MGMVAISVMWLGPFEQTVVPPTHIILLATPPIYEVYRGYIVFVFP